MPFKIKYHSEVLFKKKNQLLEASKSSDNSNLVSPSLKHIEHIGPEEGKGLFQTVLWTADTANTKD